MKKIVFFIALVSISNVDGMKNLTKKLGTMLIKTTKSSLFRFQKSSLNSYFSQIGKQPEFLKKPIPTKEYFCRFIKIEGSVEGEIFDTLSQQTTREGLFKTIDEITINLLNNHSAEDVCSLLADIFKSCNVHDIAKLIDPRLSQQLNDFFIEKTISRFIGKTKSLDFILQHLNNNGPQTPILKGICERDGDTIKMFKLYMKESAYYYLKQGLTQEQTETELLKLLDTIDNAHTRQLIELIHNYKQAFESNIKTIKPFGMTQQEKEIIISLPH